MRDFSVDFLAFWHVYPRKVGKLAAWEEWRRLAPKLDDVLAALAWQRETDQWLRDGGQFIPHPRTYLHQGRWEDEPVVVSRKTTKAHLSVVKEPPATFRPLRCETHEKNPRWENLHPVDWCGACREQMARKGTRQSEPVGLFEAMPAWMKGNGE